MSPAATPRSYIIDVPTGRVRRNRAHIIPQPAAATSLDNDEPPHNAVRNEIITWDFYQTPDRLAYIPLKKGRCGIIVNCYR